MTTAKAPASAEKKAAAKKSIVDVFFKKKKEAPPPKLEDLAEKKAEALQMVNFLKAPADMKVRQGAGLAAAMDGLEEFDFLMQTGGGRTIMVAGAILKSKVHDLTDKRLPELFAVDQGIQNAKTGEELAKQLDKFISVETKFLNTMAEIAVELENVGQGTQDMVEDLAVKAWVKENPDKYQMFVSVGLKIFDCGLSVATELTPPQFKAIPATLQALKPVFDKAVMSADAQRQMENYKEANLKGAVFAYHNENPLSIASMLVEKHKTNIGIALGIVGIGGAHIPGWIIIKPGLQMAADMYFDTKLAKAKAELENNPPASWEQIGKDLFANMKDGVKDAMWEVVTNMEIPDEKTMAEAAKSVLRKMLQGLVDEIAKALPIEPAQAVTGDALIAQVEKFATAGVLTETYHRAGQKQEADYVTPTEDSEGRKIDTILSTMKEKDDAGDFLWVRIAGEVGKLRLDGNVFAAEENEELAQIPTEDARGRKIDEVRAGKEGTSYMARIGPAWGLLDPATRKFTATRIDDSQYASWSKRQVRLDGYTEEDGTEVAGEWYRWGNKPVFMFWNTGNNVKEWAQGASLTGNAGSTKYNILSLLGDKAKPLTLQL
jgi:hypothetical protein